jgi:hypothetical protein
MDLSTLDPTSLTFGRFFVILLTVALVDFVVGVTASIVPPNYFDWSKVAQVLKTHGVERVLPIGALAFIALSFPPGSEHDLIWATAVGGLVLYVGETLRSLAGSIGFAQAASAASKDSDTLDDGDEEILPGVPS